MVRFGRDVRKFHLVAALVAAVAAAEAQQAAPVREPASKAAAILTWSPAKREQYIAALDSFFLTRTVKTGTHVHVLDNGRRLAAFEPGGPRASYFDQFLSAQRVRGVLVLQDGRIRLERYVSPQSRTTRWNSFSVAKSVTSTLVGAAMKDGSIKSLDDPVTRYIKELHGSAYDAVTVRQLLTMTSGVKWNEDYTDMNSDVARMYALPPDPGFDMTTSYVRKLPREAPPGTKWVYKTSETNLVGVLVADATGKKLANYLSEKIWRPYGMERDAEWMIDDVGDEQGGCCLAVTLRDYGRFGQFILAGARIDGTSIVADDWLPEATRSQVSLGGGSGYGYQWWTRDDGTFEGRGIYGQTLHIDRARRLVIVINSATEQPTDRASGQARQEFIAAVSAELDAEQRSVPTAPATAESGFTSLFNGKDLTGWKVGGPQESFSVQDGAIVTTGQTAHLYYDGDFHGHAFRNFELKVDVMTRAGANGGVYVLTEYESSGGNVRATGRFPSKGFEIQVNNTHSDRIRTGSLYHVSDVLDDSPAKDDEWFTEDIVVRGDTITIGVNGKQVVRWTQPADWDGGREGPGRRIAGPGTIALQCHDPTSTVYYKNIRIKLLD